jgi:hypothetical protein
MSAAASDPVGPSESAVARALRAAFERTARERPELASQLPWGMLADPGELRALAAMAAEAGQLTEELRDGAAPESLGLAEDGLDQVI